jgi:hypothetical protein
LSGIDVVRHYDAQLFSTLAHDDGEQSTRIGFAIVHIARLPSGVMFINGSGSVYERLPRYSVRPDFA